MRMDMMKLKYSDLHEGMIVKIDGGFNCMQEGVRKVQKNSNQDFFVECHQGKHYLDSQIGEDGNLVGISGLSEENETDH